MSELREQMKDVKAPDAAQVVAEATGGARRRQVKLVVFGSVIAIAVFMTFAAKFMKHREAPEPASLGIAGPGAAATPAPTRFALPADLPRQPVTPAAQPVAALQAAGGPSALPAPASLPQAARAAPSAPGGVSAFATPVPSANEPAPSKASARAPAREAAITRPATLPAEQGSAGRPAAAPKPEAEAPAATGPKARAKPPSVRPVAKRHVRVRAKATRHESAYDRIGISEE